LEDAEVSKGAIRKLYITRVRFTKLKEVKVKELGQIKILEDILESRRVE